ncbi:MAG: L-fucose:H+ symporter permease [Prevotella sp.]|jgi:FHS family L-fucose permease-like MFS transporter
MKINLNLNPGHILSKDGVSFLIPFMLITSCFALWGFANDMTGPIVKAFSKIFRMSVTEGALVQVAFYLGYFVMAFPAALFIQRHTFKAGVIVGLTLFATGSLMFLPAKMIGLYYPFLLAYFILTCGLSFLETSCNPYIYCMGTEETATLRLNLAQAFNPIGALLGMWMAMEFVQARMNPMSTTDRYDLNEVQFNALKDHDLSMLIGPYLGLGIACVILLVLIVMRKMPKSGDKRVDKSIRQSMKELAKVKNYREGVIAEFFYVGAQVTCWTFIIQYGTRVFLLEGMEEKAAEILSQKYNIAAMLLFCLGRFVCTWILKYVSAGRLLAVLAILAGVLVGGVVLFPDRNGLYCLVGVSGCMSLMFPTIYGLALRGTGENVKFAGAGLIMAILGGSVFPPLQAMIIDTQFQIAGLASTNLSFIVPFICFIVVALYGHRAYIRQFVLEA